MTPAVPELVAWVILVVAVASLIKLVHLDRVRRQRNVWMMRVTEILEEPGFKYQSEAQAEAVVSLLVAQKYRLAHDVLTTDLGL